MSSPDHESLSPGRMDAISDALSRLVRRQAEIENRLLRIEAALRLEHPAAEPEPAISKLVPPPLPVDAMPIPLEESTPPPVRAAQPPPVQPPPLAAQNPRPETPRLETRLGLNWLNRVAIVTLIFGVAFFFKYAVDNEWVGPGMRVALGLAAATLSLVIGAWQAMRGQKIFAQGMTGLGLAIFYLSFYATFGFYHLLPQSVAFLLMAGTTVAAGALALHFDAQAVAILGLIGGYLTPVVLSTGEDRIWTLLAYTTLLNVGSLALAQTRRWPALAYVSLIASAGLYTGWASVWLDDETRAAGFTWLSTTFVLFFLASIWWSDGAALGILALNASTYFLASYWLLDHRYHEYVGAFTAALGLLHGVYALLAEKPTARRMASGIAAGLVTLAVPIQFAGFRITIVWALEAAVLAWLAARFQNDLIETGAGLLFVLVLFRLLVRDAWIYGSGNSYAPIVNTRFLTFAVSAACLWIQTWCVRSKPVRFRPGLVASYIGGHFVLLSALGLEVLGWAERTAAQRDLLSTETTAISILMAAYALALVTAGVALHSTINRLMGLSLMALVVVKLYLIDVWTLSRGFRITAFLGLGGLLLVASYLYSHFKPAIEKLWKDPAHESLGH